MRELSSRELAFLEQSLPEGEELQDPKQPRPSRRGRSRIRSSRLSTTLGGLLSYLPLAIGALTLIVAGVASYLYVWGRDFFKIGEVERLNSDGTLALMDSTSGGWLADTLQIFSMAPWVILGTVLIGILLMGLSMVLLGKRKDG